MPSGTRKFSNLQMKCGKMLARVSCLEVWNSGSGALAQSCSSNTGGFINLKAKTMDLAGEPSTNI